MKYVRFCSAATDPEPRTIVFCDDGEEYVADFFGARGDFERVYQR